MEAIGNSGSRVGKYTMHLRCAELGFELIASLPDTLNFSVASEWETRLPGGTNIANGAAGNLGLSGVLQAYTQQVWTNSTPLEFPLTLLFDAVDDAYKDVYLPMIMLQSLTQPTNSSIAAEIGSISPFLENNLLPGIVGSTSWLKSPGPTIYDPDQRRVELSIGKMMQFPSILVISVNAVFDTKLTKEGYPISGQCEITFRTPTVLGRSDYLKYMKVSK